MAVFTETLDEIIEDGFDIGLNDYPIFDEQYRELLNAKIVDHYRFREIGLETRPMFKFMLNRRMREIMPYYNQLYLSEKMKFDPFINYESELESLVNAMSKEQSDGTQTERTQASNTTDTESTNDSKSRALVSQTPQAQLAGYEDYATNITDTVTDGKAESKVNADSDATSDVSKSAVSNGESQEQTSSKSSGIANMTKSQALNQWRATFLNIDMMVIEELQILFMGIYTDYWNAF